ncbi:MAG TPA: ABC-2 family transporter protein [Opitutaceae bacterium]|nr:ABC-2 family transporter protein [Opitutaceae bacterium]HND62294.1 ABC-2 family transporter protein [Opitutaceae bacterium]
MPRFLQIWLASARYSIVRTMMFRMDFFVWSLVELFWMSVNLLMIAVIYGHTSSIAGWSKYEMLLLVGTALLVQRFLMGFFWSSIFEMGRNIRSGYFDFFLAQPGNILFMATTRKLDPDGLINSLVAMGVVAYAAHQLGLHPTALDLTLYAVMILCGLVIHYSILVISVSLAFWMTSAQGVEGIYFTLAEFSRLPREAFKGLASLAFVWLLPVVVVSNAPARTILYGFQPQWVLAIAGAAVLWFAAAVIIFHLGLRRYASASS